MVSDSKKGLKPYSKDDYELLPEPKYIRLKFRKIGNLQYISHLDLQRTMGRVLIRAKIPLWYTKGFNPHPKLIFAIIKHPMKVIFMSPKKASLCLLYGLFSDCGKNQWIGPALFDIWGRPKKKMLRTCKASEAEQICAIANDIYNKT